MSRAGGVCSTRSTSSHLHIRSPGADRLPQQNPQADHDPRLPHRLNGPWTSLSLYGQRRPSCSAARTPYCTQSDTGGPDASVDRPAPPPRLPLGVLALPDSFSLDASSLHHPHHAHPALYTRSAYHSLFYLLSTTLALCEFRMDGILLHRLASPLLFESSPFLLPQLNCDMDMTWLFQTPPTRGWWTEDGKTARPQVLLGDVPVRDLPLGYFAGVVRSAGGPLTSLSEASLLLPCWSLGAAFL